MKIFVSSVLALFLVGCSTTNLKFATLNIPESAPEPILQEYNLYLIEFNGRSYYGLTEEDAKKLGQNWLEYRKWSESESIILKETREQILKINKNK